MKKQLLFIFATLLTVSLSTRLYFYYQGQSFSNWVTDYSIADDQDISDFLEKKRKIKKTKKKKIPVMSGLYEQTLKVNGAQGYKNHDKDDQAHTQISQNAYNTIQTQIDTSNPYQTSAYYFTVALFNVLENIHHGAEISRHGYDPFLNNDSNMYNFDNNNPQAAQNYYGQQYLDYIQQSFQILQNTDAVQQYEECTGQTYFVKPQDGCQNNCDCTGDMTCEDNQCVGNSNQLYNFKQAQEKYLAKMYKMYFANYVQKIKMDQQVADYITQNYESGKDYDQQAIIETQITLFEICYQIQQLVVSPKQHTKNSNTFLKFDKNAFQWIGAQVKDSINDSIIDQWADGDEDLKQMLSDLKDIDGDINDLISLVQDPTNIFNWIQAAKDVLGDDGLEFPGIEDISDAFKDLGKFTMDNIGDFTSFGDLFADILPDVAFDAGALVAELTTTAVAVGGDAIGTAIACLLILCGC